VSRAARIWPQRYGTAGFFAARLTKLVGEAEPATPYPGRPIGLAGYQALDRKSLGWLSRVFVEHYGLNLPELLTAHGLEVWRRSKDLYAFPALFFERFGDLPVQGLGLLLGEDTPDGFVPSHEWVARFGGLFQAGRYVLSAEQVPAWLRGEDLPGEPGQGLAVGLVAVVFDAEGRLLGRGRILANRLKNLLPRRLI
jgi:16S rRNA (cytosine1407-C5)-methyltransferase